MINKAKQRQRVTHMDKEHFGKGEPGTNYVRTENFKIPAGYSIVGVRVAKKADLYSADCVPVCDVIVMKQHR